MLSQFLEPIDLPNPFSFPVYWTPECSSTMELARNLLESPNPSSGFLVLTDHQTQGRGRSSSKPWKDVPGTAFLSTLFLGLREPYVRPLALRVGLAVARTIEESLELPVVLKWPNDILISSRKVGGILIENLGEKGYLLGCGINLRGFPLLSESGENDVMSLEPTSLEAEAQAWAYRWNEPRPRVPNFRNFASSYLQRLHQTLSDASWRPSVQLRLAYRGQRVRLEPPGIEGILVGVGLEGELILETQGGYRQKFYSGSLRLIPELPTVDRPES